MSIVINIRCKIIKKYFFRNLKTDAAILMFSSALLMSPSNRISNRMINLVHNDQYRFLFCCPLRDITQLIRIFRKNGTVFPKFKRRVGVYQDDFIVVGTAFGRQIQSLDVFYHRAAAESVQKFALEGAAGPAVDFFRNVRQVNLNSCSR